MHICALIYSISASSNIGWLGLVYTIFLYIVQVRLYYSFIVSYKIRGLMHVNILLHHKTPDGQLLVSIIWVHEYQTGVVQVVP